MGFLGTSAQSAPIKPCSALSKLSFLTEFWMNCPRTFPKVCWLIISNVSITPSGRARGRNMTRGIQPPMQRHGKPSEVFPGGRFLHVPTHWTGEASCRSKEFWSFHFLFLCVAQTQIPENIYLVYYIYTLYCCILYTLYPYIVPILHIRTYIYIYNKVDVKYIPWSPHQSAFLWRFSLPRRILKLRTMASVGTQSWSWRPGWVRYGHQYEM